MSQHAEFADQLQNRQIIGALKARLHNKVVRLQHLQTEIQTIQSDIKNLEGTIKALIREEPEISSDQDSEEIPVDQIEGAFTPLQDQQNSDADSAEANAGTLEYEPSKRLPTEMMREEFKEILNRPDHKLRDVIFYVITKLGRPANTEELTRLIYDTKSPKEFSRARNSLSAELRAEVKRDDDEPHLWQKLNRSTYAPTDWEQESSSETSNQSAIEVSDFTETAAAANISASHSKKIFDQNGHTSLLAYN